MALGEMGMSTDELYKITPRSLFNKLYGHRKAERESWEKVRLQCYYAFSPIDPLDPEKKRLMPIERFMPFPWDAQGQAMTNLERMQAIKDADAIWQKIDANKKQNRENE